MKYKRSIGTILEIIFIISQIDDVATQVFQPAIVVHQQGESLNSERVFIAYLNKCHEIQEKTELEKRLHIMETHINHLTEKLDNISKRDGEIHCKRSEDQLEGSLFSGICIKQLA